MQQWSLYLLCSYPVPSKPPLHVHINASKRYDSQVATQDGDGDAPERAFKLDTTKALDFGLFGMVLQLRCVPIDLQILDYWMLGLFPNNGLIEGF